MNAALVFVLALVTADLQSRRNEVVRVVDTVSPAVVYIGTVQVLERHARRRSILDEFFFTPRKQRQIVKGLGSGVIIDPRGTIITNDHVIRGASELYVVLADGRQLDAEVIGSDADTDLAVLKVRAKTSLPAAKLGTSSDLMIGETAIAIGSPLGLKKTVTVGVVSAIGRTIRHEEQVFNDFIQTDASINPGNSGGPLLNVDGEIIGINSAIIASAENIGFAIPADKVRRIVKELTQFGKVRPAWVGLDVTPINAAIGRRLRWDKTYGAMVASVEDGSPASKAGFQPGDIVAKVGSTQVENADDLRSRIRRFTAGGPIFFKVFRSGRVIDLILTPIEFPKGLVDKAVWKRLGLRVRFVRGGMGVTEVRAGTAASRIGLKPGDIVLRVNNQPVRTPSAFREAIVRAHGQRSVLLLIRRGAHGYYLTLPF